MPTIAQKKRQLTPEEVLISENDLSDILIPITSPDINALPATDNFPEILTNPVQAGQRAQKELDIAVSTGRSLFEVGKDFQWTTQRVDAVKKRFDAVINPSGDLFFPIPVSPIDQALSVDSWWREEGQFLPPEILTELGIAGGDNVPTTKDILAAQKTRRVSGINDFLNIKPAEADPLQDQLAVPEVVADPKEPGAVPEIDPKTLDMANDQYQKAFDALENRTGDMGKQIMYQMAQIHEKMGASDEALKLYKQIFSVDAGFKDVAHKIHSIG